MNNETYPQMSHEHELPDRRSDLAPKIGKTGLLGLLDEIMHDDSGEIGIREDSESWGTRTAAKHTLPDGRVFYVGRGKVKGIVVPTNPRPLFDKSEKRLSSKDTPANTDGALTKLPEYEI